MVTVQAVGAGLRGTSVFAVTPVDVPALPRALASLQPGGARGAVPAGPDAAVVPPYLPVHEAVVVLESSNAWPDDAAAVAHTLTAWYLRLAQALHAKAAAVCEVTPSWLDVLWGGHVFRLRIWHERLLPVLSAPTSSGQPGLDARALEHAMQVAPLHASTVNGLSMRFPFFAPAVRLCLRWIHAHLFSGALAPEAVELLVASLFASPQPFAPPASSTAAFVRFLSLLATHNWAQQPVIVDLDGTMTAAERQTRLAAYERLHTTAALAAVTAESAQAMVLPCTYDVTGLAWTAHQPTVVLRSRLVQFARAALDTLTARALDASFTHLVQVCMGAPTRIAIHRLALWPATDAASGPGRRTPPGRAFGAAQSVMVTPLDPYDVLIHLRWQANARAPQAVDAAAWLPEGDYDTVRFKNLRPPRATRMPVVDFDPVRDYVHTLRVRARPSTPSIADGREP